MCVYVCMYVCVYIGYCICRYRGAIQLNTSLYAALLLTSTSMQKSPLVDTMLCQCTNFASQNCYCYQLTVYHVFMLRLSKLCHPCSSRQKTTGRYPTPALSIKYNGLKIHKQTVDGRRKSKISVFNQLLLGFDPGRRFVVSLVGK
jgi:hypothetical protein